MYKILQEHKKILADTLTPVSVYLSLRDHFPGSVLLESSDYQSKENCYSYIGCQPLSTLKVKDGRAHMQYPDQSSQNEDLNQVPLTEIMSTFFSKFSYVGSSHKFMQCGFMGYLSYDAVQHFESLSFREKENSQLIPQAQYSLFRYHLIFDHFTNELHIFHHHTEKESPASGLGKIESLIHAGDAPAYPFNCVGDERSNMDNDYFKEMVAKAKKHCQRGDVFQMVVSRQFQQDFQGDEFMLYRVLRAVNPSPYLFYFDYGNFKIFGSSPEAQLTMKGDRVGIHPIAGTYKRTGHDEQDLQAAQRLKEDPKENAEHVMLVDLARNDLSKHAHEVVLSSEAEIQFYSHVIHLVSEVSGKISKPETRMEIVGDTFPAGTLSGAPKYRAMELIDEYEPTARNFYGGAIGLIGIGENGMTDFNHAIIIRSFLSQNHTLTYQAGAGVVVDSDEEKELQEVNHKIGALRLAIKKADEL